MTKLFWFIAKLQQKITWPTVSSASTNKSRHIHHASSCVVLLWSSSSVAGINQPWSISIGRIAQKSSFSHAVRISFVFIAKACAPLAVSVVVLGNLSSVVYITLSSWKWLNHLSRLSRTVNCPAVYQVPISTSLSLWMTAGRRNTFSHGRISVFGDRPITPRSVGTKSTGSKSTRPRRWWQVTHPLRCL